MTRPRPTRCSTMGCSPQPVSEEEYLARRGRPCAVPNCSAKIGERMLACREHWMRLPRELRDAFSRAAWASSGSRGEARAARLREKRVQTKRCLEALGRMTA